MTKGPIAAAIDDARALLDALLANDWRDAHVAVGDTEIFIARAGGRPNPMVAAPVPAPAHAAARGQAVTAPHVATLVSTAPLGASVDTGQAVATIRVLGDETAVLAPFAGRIAALSAAPGALLEFGMPIVLLGEAD